MSEARWAAGGALVLAGAHALPSVAAVPVLRRRVGAGHDPTTVALTFDDGPDPDSTPRFLDLLDARGARATFFLLGAMTRRAPALAAEIVRRGHEVALHGDEHRNLLGRPPWAAAKDLRRGHAELLAATGRPPRFFRPPYGVLSGPALLAARRLGLRTVLWTGWGRDWRAEATPASVYAELAPAVRGGATLLLHDADCTSAPQAWRSALGALPRLLDRCAELGLRPVPLAEHLGR